MRHECLEAGCRESASHIERTVEEEVAKETSTPNPPESNDPRDHRLSRSVMLELAKREREEAEWHARMRAKMEEYL
jgi:hypothetical protein